MHCRYGKLQQEREPQRPAFFHTDSGPTLVDSLSVPDDLAIRWFVESENAYAWIIRGVSDIKDWPVLYRADPA